MPIIQPVAFARMSPDFSSFAAVPDASGGPVGPFVSIAHFKMRQPTFPPHPHAGFSAATYVLEDSAESILNRDSSGHVSVIPPGALHWTLANSGIIHEETPLHAGGMVDGLQVFINHPSHSKGDPPSRHHDEDLPVTTTAANARVKVIAGSFDGVDSSAPAHSPLTWLQVDIGPGGRFDWRRPADHEAMLYLVDGQAVVNGELSRAPAAGRLGRTEDDLVVEASGRPARFFLFAGAPLGEPVVARGPMIMNTPAELDAAFLRYRRGDMGHLEPRSYPGELMQTAAQSGHVGAAE